MEDKYIVGTIYVKDDGTTIIQALEEIYQELKRIENKLELHTNDPTLHSPNSTGGV